MANKKNKIVTGLVILLVIAGVAVAYYVWNAPRRTVTEEDGLQISSVQLVQEYQANEVEADKKYLNKALLVTGNVTDTGSNQEGFTTVMLSSEDPMSGVFCTLKKQHLKVRPGSNITINGFCSGMLSDVRLREAVIVK